MIYTRLEYALLLVSVWLLYFLFRGRSARIWILLVASLVFYSWASAFDAAIFILVVGIAYLSLVVCDRFPRYRAYIIGGGISVLALHLLIWKYLPWAARGAGYELLLPLPLGISFFTLQGIGYLVDYYKGKVEKLSIREFFLFKSFFPQVIAGPIVRGSEMSGFLKNMPNPRQEEIAEGLWLIGIGLVKKVIIADYLGIFADGIFSNPGALDRATLMLGAVTFYVQIWGDFSGYTDMGRGSALLFGLRLPDNFYSTLFSHGGTDWARRWHYTLQTWVKDYIYFPLSNFLIRLKPDLPTGSRYPLYCQIFSRYFSAMIVALWHGAALNFFIWGLMLWVIATVEEIMKFIGLIHKNFSLPRRIFNIVAMIPVFFVTGIFFRCTSMDALGDYLVGLFGPTKPDAVSFIDYSGQVYWRLALAYAIDGAMYYNMKTKSYVFLGALKTRLSPVATRWPTLTYALLGAGAAALIVTAIAFRSNDELAGFIYFRF
ncbi:MAG: MBOAT family protein [Bdellovibrionales bacterium]